MARISVRRRATTALLRPFETFFALESASGILLLGAAAVALAWANSPWSGAYFHLWETPVTVAVGPAALSKSLHHWINDGLMAVFFFVVGLELKREVLTGELASFRKAALAIAAAAGGMVVPAIVYALLNAGGAGRAGWGIPMATDIAFALGVLALLGSRVPVVLKVFLTAVAIVDDLGAVLVIAFFYTAAISWPALALALAAFLLLALLNATGVRRPLPYLGVGIVLWLALLHSGVHATIAGVLAALAIPARRRIAAPEYLHRVREYLRAFETDVRSDASESMPTPDQRDAVHAIERASEALGTPAARLEHALHPLVAFLIVPLFALANAGVRLNGGETLSTGSPITLGILLGLFAGKPVGILTACWLAVRLHLAELPDRVGWQQLAAVAILCGIGFTMSLFITTLAFDATPALLDQAKVGVLGGSVLAGTVGAFLLARTAAPATD
ncbi:MAG: Na+/H+ antiporter NhaA [Gemmatimonadetes bacterium]|nr:Na+/H+ antiporter NhaA [Gemmatimonadota bacterium]